MGWKERQQQNSLGNAFKSFGKELKRSGEIANGAARTEEEAKERAHCAELDKQGVVYCPKCYSTSLSVNEKGFGVGKAITGVAMFGPLGLLAGAIGSKKVRITCLKCGHQFYPGKK